MDLDFELTERSLDGGAHLVSVSGELDLFTAPRLLTLLSDLIDQGVSKVVVDLVRTGFIDSSGLAALVGSLKRVSAVGGRLVLVSDGSRLARTLALTGLDRVLELHTDHAGAVAALDRPRHAGEVLADGQSSDWRALRT